MPLNIRDFQAHVASNGILPDNRFEVRMGIPKSLSGWDARFNRAVASVSVTCEKAEVPGMTVVSNEVRRYGYGPMEKKPVAPSFKDAEFIFRADARGEVWDFLAAWQMAVVNFEMRGGINERSGPNWTTLGHYPHELGYKADYAVDVEVLAFNQYNEVARHVVLRDAYPTYVGDVSVAWANKNNYVRIPVTLTYLNWFRKDSLFVGSNGLSYQNGAR